MYLYLNVKDYMEMKKDVIKSPLSDHLEKQDDSLVILHDIFDGLLNVQSSSRPRRQ